ncbi:disintegrin and metalloproteinase domain-containing protein 10-like [Dendroctonus ponderosae]|uniref:disintegrin and metalloproteinase domain-containing protein 10 n=1 Tax=Dendroctonus ponderosae TaxID=77166 RepID=UPI002034C31D|nr:disintegrin and metalloproteinase domain-containing protein 10 [Dendroctonus ponderosae]XP_048519179.1 disintegrin and metalloproteinase domain-containing protein 10-like [Dendroctonus ponderosae]KAH1000055.1 hypothetical protein HUJ05_009479 [Dendroctonus ponderosae]KAH1000062.1 hypothetical protein HUJ05_012243 [Dendroctonus ponderosae]
MFSHVYTSMQFPKYMLILLSTSFLDFTLVHSIFQVDTVTIHDYHFSGSQIYEVNNNFREKRDVLVSSRPEFLFDINLSNDGKPLTVHIKQRDSEILADNFTWSGNLWKTSNLYEGYISNYPETSSVNGYVKEGNFYGHIILNNTMYYIDEYKPALGMNVTDDVIAERNALVFKRDSVTYGIFLAQTKSANLLFKQLVNRQYYENKYQKWKQNGMLCPLVVVIDNSFLTLVHKSNTEAAISQVLFSLEEANAIFRSTDFDGDGVPDNIGFYVKKIEIWSTGEATYFLPRYTPGAMRVFDYLTQFMKYEELPKHCLGIVFTAQKFDKGTLGASYTPDSTSLHPTAGICDKKTANLGTMNGLVITASTSRTPLVNQVIFEVTITHELGHSFGALHDERPECFGYLMSPKSFADYYGNRTHLMFSPCSKGQVLRTLVMKGDCFEPVQTTFCGNGIVEQGEDCDCGLTRDCLKMDPCCVPRRTKEYPCQINKKRGFQCHPSQGECCTNSCKYSTHLEHFVNCKNFDRGCPCTNSNSNCTCGLNGVCIGSECHSIECGRIGLKQCQCLPHTIEEKVCSVCCQYQNSCLPALEATNHVLSSIKGRDVLKSLLITETVIYNPKQFSSKTFCMDQQCVKLEFFQARFGGYCLHKGKLGKCQPNSQCAILKAKQSFPSFQSASTNLPSDVISTICYWVLNRFLTNLLF